jgi:hypothetical protein
MLDDIKKTLWATADKLRANMDAAEYKHLVLGLIFVKYISDTFAARRAELARRFADPDDDYHLDAAELIAAELEDRDYYREVNVFWVPESARFGLIFVKYISDTFAARRAELARRFADPDDDYHLDAAELIAAELEDRDSRSMSSGCPNPHAGKRCAPPPSSPTSASASTMR